MARNSSTKMTAQGAWQYADADGDSFLHGDVQGLGKNFEFHVHDGSTAGDGIWAVRAGLDANKPAAVRAGLVYWAYDTGKFYIDNGVAMVMLPNSGGGDLSGLLSNASVISTHLSVPLPVAQGGTGLGASPITIALGGTGNVYGNPYVCTVTSATTYNLANCSNGAVTGTVASTDLSNPPLAGSKVKLAFQSAGAVITSGNHWHLSGGNLFTSVANGVLEGVIDGSSNFVETYRSLGQGGSGYRVLGVPGTATANQSITSTVSPGTDVTGLSVTCTPNGTNDVKVTVSLPDLHAASGTGPRIALQKDGSIVDTYTTAMVSTGTLTTGISLTYVDHAPSNASHTYKVSIWLSGADTLSTINGDGTSPTNLILVEQIG